MPSAALAQLESLLSARKLDHTLAPLRSPLPGGAGASNEQGLASTRSAAPDTLSGELPRGQISELVGSRSSGRQTVLVSWLAAATRRGELTALVDPLDMFDPSSAAARGVDLARVLWVRGCALAPASVCLPREIGELRVQIERAVKALNLILQASAGGGFGLAALDLGEVPAAVINRLPFTTWRRLHRVIDGGDTACVVVASDRLARSVGGITLELEAAGSRRLAAGSHNVLPAAGSQRPAVMPHHVRLFPDLQIAGRAIHARGMRTSRFALSFDAEDAEDRRGTPTKD